MTSESAQRCTETIHAIYRLLALSLLAVTLATPAFAAPPDEEMPESDLWWWERAAHAVLDWWSDSDTVLPPIELPSDPVALPSDPAVLPPPAVEPPVDQPSPAPEIVAAATVEPLPLPAAVDPTNLPPAPAMGRVQITGGGFVAAEVACAETGYRERTPFGEQRSVSIAFSNGCALHLEGARSLTLRGITPGTRLICDVHAGVCSADGSLR